MKGIDKSNKGVKAFEIWEACTREEAAWEELHKFYGHSTQFSIKGRDVHIQIKALQAKQEWLFGSEVLDRISKDCLILGDRVLT